MAILLIIIAIILFFIARALYKLADSKQDHPSEARPSTSGLPLYQSLSYEEKLNIMCLTCLCGGLAKSPYAKQEAQKLVAFISQCVGVDLNKAKSHLLNLINTSEDDSFMDGIIRVVASISDKNVIDMVAFNCYALWSFEQSKQTEEHVMDIIHKLGYSNQEFEELLAKQKAISDTM